MLIAKQIGNIEDSENFNNMKHFCIDFKKKSIMNYFLGLAPAYSNKKIMHQSNDKNPSKTIHYTDNQSK